MSKLKRLPVKYIRDYIKKNYKVRDCCFICRSTQQLELHHLYSVSELFERWCVTNKIREINCVEEIQNLRVQFALDCADELSQENLYTLCKPHHQKLHSLFGKSYSNYVALKVKNWLKKQQIKHGEELDGTRTTGMDSRET